MAETRRRFGAGAIHRWGTAANVVVTADLTQWIVRGESALEGGDAAGIGQIATKLGAEQTELAHPRVVLGRCPVGRPEPCRHEQRQSQKLRRQPPAAAWRLRR